MSGKYHTPEFIDKVRQLAASGMSASDAGIAMSTKDKTYSRSAMLGVSHREKFKFGSGQGRGRTDKPRAPRKAQTRKFVSSMTLSNGPTPHIVAVRKLVTVPQRTCCSWHECNRSVEEGDMFCAGHNRKGLM